MTDFYIKLNAGYYFDPKVQAVSGEAELLFVRALCHAKTYLTDGFISDRTVAMIRPHFVHADVLDASEFVEELVHAELWAPVEGGYKIVAWRKHNLTRDAIQERRSVDAERKRKARTRGKSPQNVRADTDPPSAKRPTGRAEAVRPCPTPSETETETETETSLLPSLASQAPAPRPRNEVWDAVMEACGVDSAAISPGEASRYGKVVKELRALGATPAEVHHRAGVYRRKFAHATLTPTALLNQWGACAALPPPQKPATAIDRLRAGRSTIDTVGRAL